LIVYITAKGLVILTTVFVARITTVDMVLWDNIRILSLVTASMGNIKQTSLSNLGVVIQGGLGTANCLGSEITPFTNTLVSCYTNGNLLVKLIQTHSHEQDHCLPQTNCTKLATMLNVVYGVGVFLFNQP